MRKIIPAALLTLALISMPGCMLKSEFTVGKDIKQADFTEFYYTVDSSTYPPEFQRYRFYTENGKYYFYHEKREGDHWPLTEADATIKGSIELTPDEWSVFWKLIEGGTVIRRSVSTDSGGRGPWLYLYWKKDRDEYQEFSFESYDKEGEFESFCEELRDRS